MTYDLTTESGVLQYLKEGLFPNSVKATRLQEGVSAFVYRIATEPLHDRTVSFIVKHVQDYAARSTSYRLEPSRIEYEYKALTMLPDFLAEKDGTSIGLPKVLHFDDKAHVLVLEDVGDVPSLKSWLSDAVPVDLCRSIGTSLGEFLAEVQDIALQKPALKGLFKDNKTAKQLSALVYFGKLPAAAARFGFHGSFIADAAAEGQREILEANEVLSLGDFWPGNILVSADHPPGGKDTTKIYVVDLEFCQAGTKWFDIGQMAAELYCLARFRDEERGREMLEGFLRGYKSGAGKVEACKVAIRIGAHLVVMGPVGWERQVEQAALRKVVEEGIEMIRAGHEQDIEALRKTIVAMFLKEEEEKS